MLTVIFNPIKKTSHNKPISLLRSNQEKSVGGMKWYSPSFITTQFAPSDFIDYHRIYENRDIN